MLAGELEVVNSIRGKNASHRQQALMASLAWMGGGSLADGRQSGVHCGLARTVCTVLMSWY